MWQFACQFFLETVQHADTFFVQFTKRLIGLLRDVFLEHCRLQMMNCFPGVAPAAIYTFYLVANMPVVVLFSQLCKGAVR
jgi:hypothetical protein